MRVAFACVCRVRFARAALFVCSVSRVAECVCCVGDV